MGGYEPETLTAAVGEYARGASNGERAAIELLVEHDYWVRRISYSHPEFVRVDPENGRPYTLDWRALARAVDEGPLRASTSELAVLTIALSLCGAVRVDLGQALSGLGAFNAAAVLRAVAVTTGHPDLAPAATQNA